MVRNRWFWGSVSCLVIVGAAAQPYRPLVVVGRSMAPTYRDGELLWTTPLGRPLRRGDVVVADGPEGPVIKRVALLPGDRRRQWRNRNGWTDMTIFCGPQRRRVPGRMRTCSVPPGTVFLLGDDLRVSVDSREFGPVPIESVRSLVVDSRTPDPSATVAETTPQTWLSDAILAGARRWAMGGKGVGQVGS